MRVSDLIRSSVVTADRNEAAGDALQKMVAGGFHHLPVTEDGALVGIVTALDLAGCGTSALVGDLADAHTPTVRPGDDLAVAVAAVGSKPGCGAAVVVGEGGREVVGIVTATDIVWAMMAGAGEANPNGWVELEFDPLKHEIRSALLALAQASCLVTGWQALPSGHPSMSRIRIHVSVGAMGPVTAALSDAGFSVIDLQRIAGSSATR